MMVTSPAPATDAPMPIPTMAPVLRRFGLRWGHGRLPAPPEAPAAAAAAAAAAALFDVGVSSARAVKVVVGC